MIPARWTVLGLALGALSAAGCSGGGCGAPPVSVQQSQQQGQGQQQSQQQDQQQGQLGQPEQRLQPVEPSSGTPKAGPISP
ncbi:MAG: hypothetical protein HY924_10215 [Elusimicrobia bacterium]|nr:hypothetical protein [Elusimicrobiota bacterium]